MTTMAVAGYPALREDTLPAPGGVLRPGGSCTLCARAAAERLAWGGEKVCWDCFDGQLDLLILALRQVEEVAP
jgi:hypothetical protein